METYQKQLDEEKGRSYQQGQQDRAKEVREEIQREYQGKIDTINRQRKRLEDQVAELSASLKTATELGGKKWDAGFRRGKEEQARENQEIDRQWREANDSLRKHCNEQADQVTREKEINKALTSQIEELQEDLKAAEAREEKRAKQLEALRQERDSREMADARGGLRADTPGAVDLGAAVQSFLGTVGAAPQMGNLLAGMNREARETVTAYVEAVAKWVDGMRDALAVVLVDGQVR